MREKIGKFETCVWCEPWISLAVDRKNDWCGKWVSISELAPPTVPITD